MDSAPHDPHGAKHAARHMAATPASKPRPHRGRHVLIAALVVIALACACLAAIARFHPFGLLEDAPASSQDASSPASSDDAGNAEDGGGSGSSDAQAPAATAIDTSTIAGKFAAGQIKSVRLIGDSITAGYLCDGWDDATLPTSGIVVYSGPEGTAYETSSGVRDWANDFRTWAAAHGVTSFVNAGVGGYRMSYLAEDPDGWLAGGADLVVVMLGTNDAARSSQDQFRAACETGLAAAAAKAGTLLVVSPPTNDRTDTTNRYGMDEVDQILTEVCAEHGWQHVSLLDVLELGTDDFNPDQVHPTTTGSDKLWAALEERLGLQD